MTRTDRRDPRRARRRLARKAPSPAPRPRDARFRFLAEHSRDIFFSMRFPEGCYEYISPGVEELFGLTPQDFYADPETVLRCVAPAWRETVAGWIGEIAQGRAAEEYEFQVVDRHGRLRWLHQRQVLAPTPDGRGMLLQGVATDVTELREAQRELRENEARFRTLAENSRDVFFSMRLPEYTYEFISSKVMEIHGLTPQDFYDDPGLFFRQCLAPEWHEAMLGWMDEVSRGVLRDKYEFEVLDRHGHRRWIKQRMVLVPAPDGRGMVLHGVAMDHTEEHAVQEALRRSEGHFRQLIEAWPEQVMLSVNLSAGRHEYVSPSMERVMGYAPQEFYDDPGLGMRVVAPQWQDEAWGWIAELRQGIVRPAFEFELVHKNGEHRWIHQVGALRPREPGQDLVVQFTFRDITEERGSREALRRSEERYRQLVESWTDQVVMRINLDTGRPEYVSPSIERLFGHKPETLLGPEPMQIVAPEWRESIGRWIEENRRGEMRPEYQHEILDAQGNRRWVSARGALVKDAQGRPAAVQLVLFDITERRRLEEELRNSRAFLDCVIEQSPMSMWISDETGTLIRCNQALRELFQVAEEEVVGRFNIFLDNQVRELGFMPQIRRVFESGGTTRFMLPYSTDRIEGLDLARSSTAFLDVTISAVQDAQGRTTNLIVQHLDISEHKRTEAALARNEALLQTMLRNLPFDFWARDRDQRVIMQSDESVRLWGDLTRSTMSDSRFDEETLGQWRVNNSRALAGEIVSEERALTIKSGERREFHNIVAPIREDSEILGLIGVNIDITAQKQAEAALRKSEERYRLIVETANEGIMAIDEELRILYGNKVMVEMLGYAEDELLRLRFSDLFFEEDLPRHKAEVERRKSGLSSRFERRFRRKDGTELWAIFAGSPVLDEAGTYRGAFGMFTDITERKQAEAALRESEERFREVVEGTQSLITQVDGRGRFTYVNPVARTVFGLAPEDCVGRLAFDFIHPDDREPTVRAFMSWVEGGLVNASLENRQVSLSGEVRHFAWHTHLHYDEFGRITLVDGIARDITERKLAEEALRETNARYTLLAENLVDVIWTTDEKLRWTYLSPSAGNVSGLPMAQLMAMRLDEVFTPESMRAIEELMARRQQAETQEERDRPYRLEMDLRHASGALVPLEVLVRPLRGPDGEISGYCGTARDVTQRRAVEAQVLRQERINRILARLAADLLECEDLAQAHGLVGLAARQLSGCPESWIGHVDPQTRELVWAGGRSAPDRAHAVPVLHAGEELGRIAVAGKAEEVDPQAPESLERLAALHAMAMARIHAEAALRKSERLSRKLLESMHEGVWAVGEDLRTIFVNERLCAMLGYTSEELADLVPTDVLEWPQRQLAEESLQERQFGLPGATDYVLTRKDGTRFPAHVLSSPIMEAQGRYEGLVCGVVDLTERARMEYELRRNQARFEALYEISRLTPATERQLASFTLREAIRLTDSAAGVLFFASPDGKTLEPRAWETGEFMPGGQVPSFPASGPLPWARVLHSGRPLLLNDFAEFAGLAPPGHPAVTRFLGVPALDGERPVAVLALTGKAEPYVSEDTLQTTLLLDGMWRVVRARRDEERIRASLREKDALLHEVHHRVKNNLQVISSLLDLAGRRLASAEARLSLDEVRGKVQAMSLIHAQLHSAGSAGGISLDRFVRALFNQLREVYAGGLDLSLRLKLGSLTLALDQAVPLGLALNEALANVFKHACPPDGGGDGRASRVELRAVRNDAGQVTIEVQDDGPGLPEGLAPAEADSLGLKLMHGLVLHQLRGELTFTDAGPGVCVRIRFQAHVAK